MYKMYNLTLYIEFKNDNIREKDIFLIMKSLINKHPKTDHLANKYFD